MFRIIIGAVQAQTSDNEEKEETLREIIWTIDKKYNHAKCIYIDLNSDINK